MLLGWGELLQCLSQHSCIKTQREFYITVNKACMRSNLSKLCIFYIKNNAVKLLTCKWNTSRQASIYHAHKSLSNHHMRYSEKVYLHHQKDSEARWQLTVSTKKQIFCFPFVLSLLPAVWALLEMHHLNLIWKEMFMYEEVAMTHKLTDASVWKVGKGTVIRLVTLFKRPKPNTSFHSH